jgi:fibronectin type 3 domain-containing protein
VDLTASTTGSRIDIALPLPPVTAPAAPAAPGKGSTAPKAPTKGTPPAAGTAPATATAPAEPVPLATYFAVRTYGKNGERSDFSNIVPVVPKAPPAAPQQVTTTPRGDGIQVEWAPVAGTVAGYNVYRRGAQERSNGKPIHTSGTTEKSWLDTTAKFGQDYIYSVTALSQLQPPIESAIGSEHEVHYVDRFAPPPPTELVALAEAGRVRLVWRASEADDVAGYIVYRREDETGKLERVTAKPVESAEYLDTAVAAGKTYIYRVTAIDQAGNESGPSNEVRAAVP